MCSFPELVRRVLPCSSLIARTVACQHFPDDQTLRLQAGAGEDDVIHLPSGLDRVDCERQEEEEESRELLAFLAVFHSWFDPLFVFTRCCM